MAREKAEIQKKDDKSMSYMDGKMLVIKGSSGAQYAWGLERPIKGQKDCVLVVNKAFNPMENSQRFTYDKRTKSIRLYHKKDFAVGKQTGFNAQNIMIATIWRNTAFQKGWTFSEGTWRQQGKGKVNYCIMFSEAGTPGQALQYQPCAKSSKFRHSVAQIQFDERRSE